MERLLYFLSLADPNVRMVVIGAVLLTGSSAIVGCFTLLRKRALIGDAIAHSVLPGICLAFLLSGTKDPLYLMLGAFITGWLSVFFLNFIVKNSRIKEDAALGLVLSVFFGIGILLLTAIQHSGMEGQTGLDNFLFGKATSLMQEDLIVFGILAIVLLICVLLFFKEFTLLAFDEQYARSIGRPVRFLEFLLSTLTVFAVVVGIQAVGVVLMAAMLITPAAAARFWTNDIRIMVILAACLGAFSGLAGSFVSFVDNDMPTGPWIVLVVSFLAFASFLFAPKKGILYRLLLQFRYRRQILEENILKTLYHLGEKDGDFFNTRSMQEVMAKRAMPERKLRTGLSLLKSHGYLEKSGSDAFRLTSEGKEKGQRITRTHRLWELYLTNFVNIAPDHVHEDAETIEHILTPELERRIEKLLNRPEQDPHASNIPYKEQ